MNSQNCIDLIQIFFPNQIEAERVIAYITPIFPAPTLLSIDFIRQLDFHTCRFKDKEEPKQLGAFYTPSVIVNYLGRELLILKLMDLTLDQVQKKIKNKSEERNNFIQQLRLIKEEISQAHHFIISDWIQAIHEKIDAVYQGEIIKALIKALASVKIIDPSCGSGNFLIELMILKAECYLQICQLITQSNLDPAEYLPKQAIIMSKNIFGIDIDPLAIKIARFRIFLLESILQSRITNTTWDSLNYRYLISQIIQRDILKSQELAKINDFDLVIGNPPYINLIESPEFRLILEKRYPAIYHGKLDFSYYFIPISMDLINNKGIIGFVMKRYFLKSSVARNLRRYFKSKTLVHEIIDFGKNKVFKGAGIDTLLIIFQPKASAGQKDSATPIYYINQTISHEKPLEAILRLQSSIPISKMVDRWLLETNNIHNLFEKSLPNYTILDFLKLTSKDENQPGETSSQVVIEAAQLDTRLFKLVKGIQTGKDEIFVINADLPLESEKTRIFLKGQHITAYKILESPLKLIISHQYSPIIKNHGRSVVKYPLIERYLRQHQSQLSNRSRAQGDAWSFWRKGDERNSIDFTIPKIIWPYRGETFNAAIDTRGCYHSQDVILFTLNTKELERKVPKVLYEQILCIWKETLIYFYLGLLNSRVFKDYLYPYAKEFALHTKDFQPNNFIDLHLPLMNLHSLIDQELMLKSKLVEKLINTSTNTKEISRVLNEIEGLTQKLFEKKE